MLITGKRLLTLDVSGCYIVAGAILSQSLRSYTCHARTIGFEPALVANHGCQHILAAATTLVMAQCCRAAMVGGWVLLRAKPR